MKQLIAIFLTFILLATSSFGSGRSFSSIPLPQSIFLDTNGMPCNSKCLKDFIEQGFYFSFISRYSKELADEDTLQELYTNLSVTFDLDAQGNKPAIKLAVLFPQKRIRGYAISTVNTIIAYLLHRDHHFDIEIFNIEDEDEVSIKTAIDNIDTKGYHYVVAPLTLEGATHLANYSGKLRLFIPTVHKSLIQNAPESVLFGGINYEQQIEALMSEANGKVALFSDGSLLANSLDSFVRNKAGTIIYNQELGDSKINFKSMLNKNTRLDNSSVFLNTPLVKSSLLASQLRVYDIKPYVLLSTQINYHPMLLTLTQYEDREKLLIANAIDFVPSNLRIINSLLGHSLEYDWVNYATSIGIDHFYVNYFNTGATPLFKEYIIDGQVAYKTKLFRANRYQLLPAR
ncbi:MAG: hypothetical protein GX780_06560 [Campylobacteraceae bacterium]|nr:hypothetical protein [Campylobacteraceae bacterium]